MFKRTLIYCVSIMFLLALPVGSSFAGTINLNAPQLLGNYNLKKSLLKHIKKSVEKALRSPVDSEIQCGAVKIDCVVRAVREWKVGGNRYREIVIDLHFIGHASITVEKAKKKWDKIAIK